MTVKDLLELIGLFFVALLLVLTPVSLVMLARIGRRGVDTGVVGTLFRACVIAAVFAPCLLPSPAVPRRGIPEMVVPAPFLFALAQVGLDVKVLDGLSSIPALLGLLLPAFLAWVSLLWLMLHFRGKGWSEDARSTRTIKRLSFAGPLLVFAAPAVPAAVYRSIGPYPLMWAGAATMGWSFFLLFLTGSPSSSDSSRWLLRAWLAGCFALGAFTLVLGFGFGIAIG